MIKKQENQTSTEIKEINKTVDVVLASVEVKYSRQRTASVSMGWLATVVICVLIALILLNDFIKVVKYFRQKKTVGRKNPKVSPYPPVNTPTLYDDSERRENIFLEVHRLNLKIAKKLHYVPK